MVTRSCCTDRAIAGERSAARACTDLAARLRHLTVILSTTDANVAPASRSASIGVMAITTKANGGMGVASDGTCSSTMKAAKIAATPPNASNSRGGRYGQRKRQKSPMTIGPQSSWMYMLPCSMDSALSAIAP